MVLFCLCIFVSHLWLYSIRIALGWLCQCDYSKKCSHATVTQWKTTVTDFEMVAKKREKTSVTIRLLQFSKSLRVKAANVTTKWLVCHQPAVSLWLNAFKLANTSLFVFYNQMLINCDKSAKIALWQIRHSHKTLNVQPQCHRNSGKEILKFLHK